jgi:predicted RNA binding protein YcfA (HicA-like mRNA interferase family)
LSASGRYRGRVAKGRQVRKALEKAGWTRIRQSGSHVHLQRGIRIETFAYHDSVELGQTQLRFVAKKFGLSLDELKRLL